MKTSHFEVSFEQHEIWRLSRADGTGSHICPICTDTSHMIAAEIAASVLQFSTRQIYWLIDADAIHYVETENMQMLICLASLSQRSAGEDMVKLAAGQRPK